MRLTPVIIAIVLAVALGAVNLWTSKATSDLVFSGMVVGAALGMGVLAWIVGTLLRNRQRRRLMDMRIRHFGESSGSSLPNASPFFLRAAMYLADQPSVLTHQIPSRIYTNSWCQKPGTRQRLLGAQSRISVYRNASPIPAVEPIK